MNKANTSIIEEQLDPRREVVCSVRGPK